MDSTDDNAVTNESEVRKTRSGRAVRPPLAQAPKQSQRKTRKKMVLVEVEVSEEEEDNQDTSAMANNADGNGAATAAAATVETVETGAEIESGRNSSDAPPAGKQDAAAETETNASAPVPDDSNSENPNEYVVFHGDSSTDQNDSQSAQFGLTNDSDVNNFPEHSDSAQAENQDSMQTENSAGDTAEDEPKEPFDVSVLNNDSQTQHKPDEKEHDGEEEEQKGAAAAAVEPMHVEERTEAALDPDTEVISEDELPAVQAAKVPETEEVSDEELPGPKLAELPADTEVVSEDELPSVKKEGGSKRKLESEYDPGSPTSESEQSAAKKPALEGGAADKKEPKETKPRKLPELDKYWKAVNDDPTDFTGWTYLLQYVDQEDDMEAAREAYDAFLSHYPYCYGYWRKYADYEKRKGSKKKCEEVFERGLKAIPLSVDLWLHYLNYTRGTRADDDDYVRSQYERALAACGLEFRSDRLWEGYIKWEADAKRLQRVTSLYDRLLATPTQGYTSHFDNFQEHVAAHPPNKILEVDEFLALRKEIKHMLKHGEAGGPDATASTAAAANTAATAAASANPDAPPGEGDAQDSLKSDEETTALRERIVSIRRKIHKTTVNAVTARWNYEEGIKRPYFHVKPLERCQLKNWKEYLDFEMEAGEQRRIVVLFERCLIACALYEEFWLRFVHYLEGLGDAQLRPRIRDVYERACTIHHLNKPSLHLQWAMFEECCDNYARAAEILVNLEKSVPNLLQVAYRRINLERRRNDLERCAQLYEHYINNSKNKMISTNLAIKYARFCHKVCGDADKAREVLARAVDRDAANPRLYLQLIDLALQRLPEPAAPAAQPQVLAYMDQFLGRDAADLDQKVLFAQRKLEFLEDFGSDIQSVQRAYDDYQKYCKLSKDKKKRDEAKGSAAATADPAATAAAPSASAAAAAAKKSKEQALASTQSGYGGYGAYPSAAASAGSAAGASYAQYSGTAAQGQYGGQYGTQYSQNDQYQYQNWQYSQSGYGGYNQWGSYGNYY